MYMVLLPPKLFLETKKLKENVKKTQWTKFTYIGRETRVITKVFKNTRVKIAYSTKNTLGRLLTRKTPPLTSVNMRTLEYTK